MVIFGHVSIWFAAALRRSIPGRIIEHEGEFGEGDLLGDSIQIARRMIMDHRAGWEEELGTGRSSHFGGAAVRERGLFSMRMAYFDGHFNNTNSPLIRGQCGEKDGEEAEHFLPVMDQHPRFYCRRLA